MRWWIPNALTVLRLFAAPGVPVMYLYYARHAAGLLKVTKLAKWKTTFQMLAIAVLFLGTGLGYVENTQERVLRWTSSEATIAGLILIWIAAALTFVTGLDYFLKALPHLKGSKDD
jgi:phosphatidylglycerophosphate synthase